MTRRLMLMFAAITAGFAGQELLSESLDGTSRHSTLEARISGCSVNGNISLNTGERIYHIPGQKHYSETVITPSKGER